MKILIAGAGEVGFHLAKLMTTEEQNIILIDHDENILEYASRSSIIMTVIATS